MRSEKVKRGGEENEGKNEVWEREGGEVGKRERWREKEGWV